MIEQYQGQDSQLFDEYIYLYKNYKSLYKQLAKLLKMTDKQQTQMIKQLEDQAKELQHQTITISEMLYQTIETISSIAEMRDPYTAGHQRRVAKLAEAIGIEMGFDQDQIEGLHFAGLLHDTGKIYVPTEILCKPGKLSEHEFLLIKDHTIRGYNILKEINCPWPIAEVAYSHHERVDGTGYPRGLKGNEIIIEARIIAVADTVETISTHRPYRPAIGIEAALDFIIKSRNIQFDSDVVDACVTIFKNKRYKIE